MRKKISILLAILLIGMLFIMTGCFGGETSDVPAVSDGGTTDDGADEATDNGTGDEYTDLDTVVTSKGEDKKEIGSLTEGNNQPFENVISPDSDTTVYAPPPPMDANRIESEEYYGGIEDGGFSAPPEQPSIEPEPSGSETFEDYGVNRFTDTSQDPYSTFSIDVDTGSYTLSRRKINGGGLPPKNAVRVEEFVNYFDQDYSQPKGEEMFFVSMDGAPSPFNKDTYLLRVGLQGKEIKTEDRLPANLVFLIDVSGSMSSADKLGLVQKSLSILVENLGQMDSIAICTYAGRVAEILPPTGVEDKEVILNALNSISSGGSTGMASGIELAYDLASRNFRQGGINRVIVCSDGDANVGTTSHEKILEMISTQTEQGITLSTLGFGTGNYNDVMMEQLADNGNGNYFYIDSQKEADRIFTQELTGTLQVIAKDVKIQVEFDPDRVKEYRLIGYENRDIADKEFRDDTKDAGEVGAGHSVTALYEIVLNNQSTSDLGLVQLRYKLPDHDTATEFQFPFKDEYLYSTFSEANDRFRFIVSVAEFAEILRGSEYAKGSLEDVLQISQSAYDPKDANDTELVGLIEKCIKYKKQGY